MLVLLALLVALVSIGASALFAVMRGLEAFGALKGLGRAVAESTARIEESAARIEAHLALAAESGSRLEASLARLRRSRAQLNVLRSALDDARGAVGRVTAVVPRP
jgi:phage shock protein A